MISSSPVCDVGIFDYLPLQTSSTCCTTDIETTAMTNYLGDISFPILNVSTKLTSLAGRFSVEPTVPIPAPYDRQIHYCQSKPSSISPSVASHTSELKQDEFAVEESDDDSLKSYEKEDAGRAVGKRQMSVLIFLRDSRIYIRVLAILIMITSFSLILGAVIKYAQARRVSGHPLDAIPKPPLGITDYPCRVFTGIAGMNLAFSIIIISLSCVSSKVTTVQKIQCDEC